MFLYSKGSDSTYMVATWCMTEAFSATRAVYIEDCEVLNDCLIQVVFNIANAKF